jgi:hypothetical protein
MVSDAEPKKVEMPEWLRKAMLAQGKVDPDEVLRKAREIDLDGATEPEQLPLVPPAPPHWQDRG